MNLSGQVADFVRREALLEPKQRLVVGVSGGADSLCLMHCLAQLEYRPIVAHFDHGLRVGSAEDAEYVRGMADKYGLPFELGRAEEGTGSAEEQARLNRYRFLAATANRHQLTVIAVGHTLDDQVETVLMHFLRGAGPAGLRGMIANTSLMGWTGNADLRLIRPLLEVGRSETVEYCASAGLEPLVDPSNQNRDYFRNRIRLDLIPELETYNPRLREVLVRTSKVMAAENELVDHFVQDKWDDWVQNTNEGSLAFRLESFLNTPLALQRAAFRRGVRELVPGLRDIGLAAVDRALTAMRDKKRQSLVGGLELVHLDGEAILLAPGANIPITNLPQLKNLDEQALSWPFKFELDKDWRMEGSEVDPPPSVPKDRYQAWFDRDQVKGEWTIRPSRPGDKLRPLGMSGSVKLSDLYVNRKVPRPARRHWPVVTCGGEVLWVAGLHRSRAASLNPHTKSVLRLRLRPPLPTRGKRNRTW